MFYLTRNTTFPFGMQTPLSLGDYFAPLLSYSLSYNSQIHIVFSL